MIGRNHHGAHRHQPGGNQPRRLGAHGEQGADRAQQADQGKGSQTGTRGRIALALKSHQQADTKRKQESLNELQADVGEQVAVVH